MPVDNSKIVYGGDLMLFVASGATQVPVGFATSAKLSISMSPREIGSKDSGDWVEKLPGKFTWNCGSDNLMSYNYTGGTHGVDTLYTHMINKSGVTIAFAIKSGTTAQWTVDATKKRYTGVAYITSIDITSPDGDNATYSVQLEGSGALTQS